MKAAVTGGAGFIGSHLSGALVKEGHEVLVLDSMAAGSESNVPKGARLVKKDLCRDELAADLAGVDAVFHFAADPDVRTSADNPKKSFDSNVAGTFRLLEACRNAGVKTFVFASTSTVYGEPDVIPTPETHPCAPISNYGASKLACEAYASSYAHCYGIRSTVLRYANIFGPGSTHGVMFDFFKKLKSDPSRLEILGNGKQEKSYLYVSDCVSATLAASAKQKAVFEAYNVGSREKASVNEIARLACASLNASPKLSYTGGERGWTGDVKAMLLDTAKIEKLGWSAKVPLSKGAGMYFDWLKARS